MTQTGITHEMTKEQMLVELKAIASKTNGNRATRRKLIKQTKKSLELKYGIKL
jgi:hypothetical protein